MELLRIPRVRNLQLQTLTEGVISICKNSEPLLDQLLNVESAYNVYIDCMQDAKKYTSRDVYDSPRHIAGTHFFSTLKLECDYPNHSKEASSTLNQICNVVNRYDKSMFDLRLDEETAAIDNLVGELQAIDLNPLTGNRLLDWMNLMVEANEKFKEVTELKVETAALNKTKVAAGVEAKKLIIELNKLFDLLFGKYVLEPNEALLSIYNKILVVIKSV